MGKFKIGDSVRVRAGVKEPDYGTNLAGWQGRITEIELKPNNILHVQWDSITLQQMSDDFIATYFANEYDVSEMMLPADDVELVEPRDKKVDVHNKLVEVYGRYGLEYQTDFESMIISMADMLGLLDEEEDWGDEPDQFFDLEQFYTNLEIDSPEEQKIIEKCFGKGLEIYYEYIYGYHKYGKNPHFLIAERIHEPYIFGFCLVEVLRAPRLSETTKLKIANYSLQIIDHEAEYGIPHGLIVLLSHTAQMGHLTIDLFRALMQTIQLTNHRVQSWQTEEAIQLSNWLISQEAMPPQEKLWWLWHLSMQLNDVSSLGKKMVNHWLAHPDLADNLKNELALSWINKDKHLGVPPASWRLVQAQVMGDVPKAEEALKELGAPAAEIEKAKAIIAEEADTDYFNKLFSMDPLLHFNTDFGYIFTPNWLLRIAVLALVRLGEDALETAVIFLDYNRDYGCEALNMGVADIIDEFAADIPPSDIRELIEKGIQIPQTSTRKRFYKLSTKFYGTEILAKTARDNAASIRKWGAKELQKLGG